MAQIKNEKDVTAADICSEAVQVWVEFMKWKGDSEKHADELDRYFIALQNEGQHRELFSSYPHVMSHMIRDETFFADVFLRYLRRLEMSPWTNDDERFESYGEYYEMLLREIQSRAGEPCPEKVYKERRDEYVNNVKSQHESFVSEYTAAMEALDAEKEVAKKIETERAIETYIMLCDRRSVSTENRDQIIGMLRSGKISLAAFKMICEGLVPQGVVMDI